MAVTDDAGPLPARAGSGIRFAALRRPALWTGVCVFAALGVAMLLRRPDAVTNPQFFAEDGRIWFEDAYQAGRLHTMFVPHGGYFQSVERLTAALGVTVGLGRAPATSNALALILEIAPVAFLLSPRFAVVVPSFPLRVALAALYVILPNAEAHANITNAQWHVALLACMVLMVPDGGRTWRVVDLSILALCGLSGPFIVLLAPLAAYRLWVTRDRLELPRLAVIAPLALLEGVTTLLTAEADRSPGPIGAGLDPLLRIIANRVVIGGSVGNDTDRQFFTNGWPHGLTIALILTAIGAGVFAAALLRGPLSLKILDLFAAGILLIALAKPQVNAVLPQWDLMGSTEAGDRYFVIPMLAWAVSLVWLVSLLPRQVALAVGAVAAAGLVVHAQASWRYPPFVDYQPQTEAAQLDATPPGAAITVPLNPPGWNMTLTRH